MLRRYGVTALDMRELARILQSPSKNSSIQEIAVFSVAARKERLKYTHARAR